MKIATATRSLAAIAAITPLVSGQFPNPHPEGMKTVKSKTNPDAWVTYKENNICETTEGVKSYSGYVHLPPGTLNDFGIWQDYEINTFFWFYESRNDPKNAPTSIWLNGGPGASSMVGMFRENGPCWVNSDSASTRINEHSWNTNSNMLYVDQPNQVGFSYDTLHHAVSTINIGNPDVAIDDSLTEDDAKSLNKTQFLGTFASQDQHLTANTTETAAKAFWHFAQVFFSTFPEHEFRKDQSISLWAESYGGKYGPGIAARFEKQNELIAKGEIKNAIPIHIDTLGIVNGCIDFKTFTNSYPIFAMNNTYDLQLLSQETYARAMKWLGPTGNLTLAWERCHTALAKYDPENKGGSAKASEACQDAKDLNNAWFAEALGLDMEDDGKVDDLPSSMFDITHPHNDPTPPPYDIGYVARRDVQEAIGVPRNFSFQAWSAYKAFNSTPDFFHFKPMDNLQYLLNKGIKVSMVYGDRDLICNWKGAEWNSLGLKYKHSAEFAAAGYQPLVVNESYVGGQVRQFGNFSFVRVYQAGHMVPYYQPETALKIFDRLNQNLDVATGLLDLTKVDNYKTKGPSTIDYIKSKMPPKPELFCYILAPETCDTQVWKKYENGTYEVKDYIVIEKDKDAGDDLSDEL